MQSIDLLIVESDYYLAQSYMHLAQSHSNNTIHIARDGQEALDYLQHHTPKILMLDMNLAQQVSFEILETLHSTDHLKDTIVVALYDDPQRYAEIQQYINFAFRKPVPFSVLKSLLDQL